MFSFLKKQPKVINNHYRSHEYINAKLEMERLFPDNIITQVEEMKKVYGSKFHVMFMAQATQVQLRDTKEGKITFDPILLEYMSRGFIDAIAHMQEDLPEGIYEYIVNNTNSYFYKCLEHSLGKNSNF